MRPDPTGDFQVPKEKEEQAKTNYNRKTSEYGYTARKRWKYVVTRNRQYYLLVFTHPAIILVLTEQEDNQDKQTEQRKDDAESDIDLEKPAPAWHKYGNMRGLSLCLTLNPNPKLASKQHEDGGLHIGSTCITIWFHYHCQRIWLCGRKG